MRERRVPGDPNSTEQRPTQPEKDKQRSTRHVLFQSSPRYGPATFIVGCREGFSAARVFLSSVRARNSTSTSAKDLVRAKIHWLIPSESSTSEDKSLRRRTRARKQSEFGKTASRAPHLSSSSNIMFATAARLADALITGPFKRAQLGLFHGQVKKSGNNVPHSKHKTRRTWTPNVQRKRLQLTSIGREVRVTLTTKALRSIKKVCYMVFYLFVGSYPPVLRRRVPSTHTSSRPRLASSGSRACVFARSSTSSMRSTRRPRRGRRSFGD
jgi:ribosomal protein L28